MTTTTTKDPILPRPPAPSHYCPICESEPGVYYGEWDDHPVMVCGSCWDYETGGEPRPEVVR